MLKREITGLMVRIFDNLIPPILRDQRWCMYLFFKIVCGKNANAYLDFKDNYFSYSENDIKELYKNSTGIHSSRETDLNARCVDNILKNVTGTEVLDVACGKGFLALLLAQQGHKVTACDFIDTISTSVEHTKIKFVQSDICDLSFENKSFDTVISTHTLEHCEDISSAISELRRVAQNRIIIVVPRQRPCKYSFDFHIHFFPFKITLLSLLGARGRKYNLKLLSGDWFYVEDIE